MNNNKEYIICSAIWYNTDHQMNYPPVNILTGGLVILGRRHHNCIDHQRLLGISNKVESIQGFLTSYDRFVKREEAAHIAFMSNQINNLKYSKEELFSEDIY